MAIRRDRDSQRFRIYTDDRTGLEFGFIPITSYPNAYTRESGKPVSDNGLKVAPSEYDQPPPSKISLGGGDVSGDPRANSNPGIPSNVYVIPPQSVKTILYVNSSSAIRPNTDPVVYIVGSNVNQVMAVNPQIILGQQGQTIAVECVGSSVTLTNGSGLTFDFVQSRIVMNSGGIVTLFCDRTDNTWHITSFNPTGGF